MSVGSLFMLCWIRQNTRILWRLDNFLNIGLNISYVTSIAQNYIITECDFMHALIVT